MPDYWVNGVRHRGGKNLILAFSGTVGSCRFDVKGRSSSSVPARTRVPMRRTVTEHFRSSADISDIKEK